MASTVYTRRSKSDGYPGSLVRPKATALTYRASQQSEHLPAILHVSSQQDTQTNVWSLLADEIMPGMSFFIYNFPRIVDQLRTGYVLCDVRTWFYGPVYF